MSRLRTWAIAALLVLPMVTACSGREYVISADETPWPGSAEFSALETGQTRFSAHDGGVKNVLVLVDHQTGVQYLVTLTGTCPLLEADGTPLLVAEAGE